MENLLNRSAIIDIAHENGLYTIETTTGNNGYPENLKLAIAGFNDFSQAKELANKYGLDICTFYKKNGWELWYRDNRITHEPIKPNPDDFGSEFKMYNGLHYDDLEDFYQQEGDYIKENIGYYSYKELLYNLGKLKSIYSEIELHDENDILITDGERFYDFKKEVMEYYYDSQTYLIGLIKL